MTARGQDSWSGTTIKTTPNKVTLGDTGFTVKNKHYRYQDILLTKCERTVLTTYVVVIPSGRSYDADIFVIMKNKDAILIGARSGLKGSAKKVTDLYHRFLSLSFKYRWETYMEPSNRMGYLWYWSYAIHPDGRVLRDEFELGRISKDMPVVAEPGSVRIGSVEIETDRDPDILFAMLDAQFGIKCV